MIPPALYIYGGLLLGGLMLGGAGAWKITSWRCDAARVEAVERAIEQMQQMEAENEAVASRFEETRTEIRTRYRTIYQQVASDPATPACDIPPSWLHAWQAANRGEKTPGELKDSLRKTSRPDDN